MNVKSVSDIIFKTVNRCLRPLEQRLVRKYNAPEYPVVFIAGLPRCGSTLLQQVIVQKFAMGYISNLQSRFWLIPYIGARLIKRIQPKGHSTDFKSKYGNTKGKWEPHEWGWFWREILDIDESTGFCRSHDDLPERLDYLNRELAALEAVCDAPLIFDNEYTLPYLADLSKHIDQSLFIYINRAPFYVANSLLNARLERYGDIKKWYGDSSRDHSRIIKLPPVEQCVAQVRSIENGIKGDLDSIERKRVLYIEYDDICSDSEKIAGNIFRFIEQNGFKLKEKNGKVPSQFTNRNRPELVNPLYREELETCYERYFG